MIRDTESCCVRRLVLLVATSVLVAAVGGCGWGDKEEAGPSLEGVVVLKSVPRFLDPEPDVLTWAEVGTQVTYHPASKEAPRVVLVQTGDAWLGDIPMASTVSDWETPRPNARHQFRMKLRCGESHVQVMADWNVPPPPDIESTQLAEIEREVMIACSVVAEL